MKTAISLAALVFAFLTCATAAEAFDAHGSVEQVYATGLAPGAKMSLRNGAGRKVATKKADAQGGLLFRNVKPGSGYRLGSSGPLTVLSTQAAPPSTDF